MAVLLPIMFMTYEQEQLDELGIDQEFDMENTDVRQIEFYSIDYIYPSSKDTYTLIGSGGETFCCPKPFKEVQKIIKDGR